MNILLLIPLRSNDEVKDAFKDIKRLIEKSGHKVNSEVLSTMATDFAKEAENDVVKLFRTIDKNLKDADAIIADVSTPSGGIGFMIANALNSKKPVLVLHQKGKGSGPVPIKAKKSKLLKYAEYSSDNVESTVLSFLDDIKKILDTKFILIISPEIDRFLEWEADQKRMHKAQIVRQAVEKLMNNDEEWKEFKKNQE